MRVGASNPITLDYGLWWGLSRSSSRHLCADKHILLLPRVLGNSSSSQRRPGLEIPGYLEGHENQGFPLFRGSLRRIQNLIMLLETESAAGHRARNLLHLIFFRFCFLFLVLRYDVMSPRKGLPNSTMGRWIHNTTANEHSMNTHE